MNCSKAHPTGGRHGHCRWTRRAAVHPPALEPRCQLSRQLPAGRPPLPSSRTLHPGGGLHQALRWRQGAHVATLARKGQPVSGQLVSHRVPSRLGARVLVDPPALGVEGTVSRARPGIQPAACEQPAEPLNTAGAGPRVCPRGTHLQPPRPAAPPPPPRARRGNRHPKLGAI